MKKLMLLAGMSAALGVGGLLGASEYRGCLDLSKCPTSTEGKRRPIKRPTERPKSKQQKQSRKQNRKKK